MRRLIRGVLVLCVTLALSASTAHAELIKDMGLILDTTTGIRWFPVIEEAGGALAIEDLDPGQRYATDDEVSTLLQTYIFPLACEFNGSPFGCSPSAFQAFIDFIHILRAEGDLLPDFLRGVFAPQGSKNTGIAMFLTLIAGKERNAYFDMQSTHYPPIPGDGSFGMFLVSTVPEPSTFVLWSLGMLLLWRGSKRGHMSAAQKG